jgi:hypothetical protein
MATYYGQYPMQSFGADPSLFNTTPPPASFGGVYGMGPEILMYPWVVEALGGVGGGGDAGNGGGGGGNNTTSTSPTGDFTGGIIGGDFTGGIIGDYFDQGGFGDDAEPDVGVDTVAVDDPSLGDVMGALGIIGSFGTPMMGLNLAASVIANKPTTITALAKELARTKTITRGLTRSSPTTTAVQDYMDWAADFSGGGVSDAQAAGQTGVVGGQMGQMGFGSDIGAAIAAGEYGVAADAVATSAAAAQAEEDAFGGMHGGGDDTGGDDDGDASGSGAGSSGGEESGW